VLAQVGSEGVRVGILGDSGTGKTHAAQAFVTAYLARSPGYVLIVDSKAEGRFGGQVYSSVAELAGRPPAPEPRVLSFRGDPFAGVGVAPDETAALAWRLAARKRPTLTVVDELEAATTQGQWQRGVRWIPQSFVMGRSHGISVLWGCQAPQGVPRQAFGQSDWLLCFRLAGTELRLLRERNYLNGIRPELVESLPGADAPPAARGAFVLLGRGRPWDGQVYRL
jgi:hypothetical protein